MFPFYTPLPENTKNSGVLVFSWSEKWEHCPEMSEKDNKELLPVIQCKICCSIYCTLRANVRLN